MVGGDFNEVLDEFRKVVDNLGLADIKLDKGWFTWSNNKRGHCLVRERLDHFFVSMSWLGSTPFLTSSVVRQASSDNDMVLLNTLGKAPKAGRKTQGYCLGMKTVG